MGGLMRTIGTLLGEGDNNSGFTARSGVSNDQLNKGYGSTQTGLTEYEQLLSALKGVNGVQNQQNVYDQYGNIAQGLGPNPAQSMLNESTAQNVANQGALMASARGASVNPALVARLAAQQGGAIQQQAAGQGATLQAQQSLAALGAQGNIAGQQVANQLGATSGYNAAAQGNQGTLLNALSNENNANAGIAGINANNSAGAVQGLVKGAAGALSLFSKGGKVPDHLLSMQSIYHPMAQGGSVGTQDGLVPGTPQVQGDSQKNDTVSALLSPGEVVIPRSIMEGPDPVKNAAKFIAQIQKKKMNQGGEVKASDEGDFKAALRKVMSERKKK